MAFRRVTLAALIALALPTYASAACACKFSGQTIPASIYQSYPIKKPAGCTPAASGCTTTDQWGTKPTAMCGDCEKWPGMYKDNPATPYYGANCAPWDQMPGTPWYNYCPITSDWGHADYNWCQQPWCYVDASCPTGVPSTVYTGSTVLTYNYLSCGSTFDCYTAIAWNASYVWPAGCPYDPNGGKTYKVHKSGECACVFHGDQLDGGTYLNYPDKTPAGCAGPVQAADGTWVVGADGKSGNCSNWPGQYKDKPAVKMYGTTCGAWDQMPGTPWYTYCPAGSMWCHYDYNWCQQPWCYVNETCSSGVSSATFKGSPVLTYSYDTCFSTPDCYTGIAWATSPTPPSACPFDSNTNGWATNTTCSSGWEFPTTTTTVTTITTIASKTGLTSSAHMVELGALAMAAVVALAVQA